MTVTGKLIYAADDEADILDVMREFLQNAGFSVRTFPTGDALYAAFQEQVLIFCNRFYRSLFHLSS